MVKMDVRIILFDVLKCNFILADDSNTGFNRRVDICVTFPQRTHIDFLNPSIVDENQIEVFLFFKVVFEGEIIAFFWLISKAEHIFRIDSFQNFFFDILKIACLGTD